MGPIYQALNSLQTLWSNITPKSSISSAIIKSCSSSCCFSRREKKSKALTTAEIMERMAGIPIYRMSNFDQDSCGLISDHGKDKRVIDLYYMSKTDAQAFWNWDRWDRADWQVLDVPLSQIFGEQVPPIRFVPESSQIKNALELRKIAGFSDDSFSGVPVFQTDHLVFRGEKTGKTYRPAYFRKEDLEKDMVFASIAPEKRACIKVAAFEDILQQMKDGSTSESNDVFFIGPGITSWTWF